MAEFNQVDEGIVFCVHEIFFVSVFLNFIISGNTYKTDMQEDGKEKISVEISLTEMILRQRFRDGNSKFSNSSNFMTSSSKNVPTATFIVLASHMRL